MEEIKTEDTHEKMKEPWTEERLEAHIAKINFIHDLAFAVTIAEGNFVQDFMNTLLPDKIALIQGQQREKVSRFSLFGKETRFDYYGEDENGNSFDIEIQSYTRDNLHKRASVYAAQLTLEQLDKMQRTNKIEGKTFEYQDVSDRFVLFICNFDVLGQGFPVYVNEVGYFNMDIPVQKNGEYQIFINLKAHQKVTEENLRNLLCYMATGVVQGDLTKRVHEALGRVKGKKDWRSKMRTLADVIDDAVYAAVHEEREKAHEKGMEKGMEKLVQNAIEAFYPAMALADIAKNLKVPYEMVERLQGQMQC